MIVSTIIPISTRSADALDNRVEKAIDWAVAIASDNSHGYSQSNRNGPDYDCSSFVSTAFKNGGFAVSGSLHTGNMLNAFVSAGFTKYNKGAVSLQRGDVLLRPKTSSRGGHTELYIGNNQCVAAHSNHDGKTGDSGGKEINVRSKNYCTFCKNSDYTYVLRYEGSSNYDNYTYSFNYNANGGTLGSSGAFSVSYGDQFQVLNTTCTRSGYTWAGWNVKRNNDNKWYVDGQGWCTESQISSNGYVKRIYPNYKTLIFDESWIGGINGNCSYTFYAVWIQARETRIKIFMSPYGRGYDHIVAMNNSTYSGFAQEQIYAWYILYDGNTGELLNTYQDSDYSVRLAIYDPNGDLVYDSNYEGSHDANWIGITPQMSGTYLAEATLTGDLKAEVATTYEVSYDAELVASTDSVSLNLNGTNTQAIEFIPSGCYPGLKGYKANLDSSIAKVTDHYWSGNRFYFTVQGIKVGEAVLSVKLYENYTGNENVVATLSIPVSVTANTYTISYSANGGSGAPSSQNKYYGTNITLSSSVPTRSGYTFLGWSTSSSATSATYQPGGTFSLNANTTLYAVWKANPTYSITYNANGGSGAPSTQTGSTNYTISSTVPIRSGYTFLGWSTSSNATTSTYEAGDTVAISANLTLYAVWKANTYTITYNANGGSGAPSSQTKTHGTNLTLSSTKPTRDGYTFLGWSTSSSATSATYQPGSSFSLNENATLYAVWKKDRELSSISIAKNPTNATYYIGDRFLDITGMEINLIYSDGSTEIVTNDFLSSGFTTSGFDSSTTGTKAVTVSYKGFTDTFTVTVNTPSVVLSSSNKTLNIGDVYTLTAITTPDDYNVTWTSSNTSVATVLDGCVTPKKAGTTVITACITYSGIKYSASCTVTVVDNILLGDINSDGVIDAGDAVLISRYDAGFITLTAEQLNAGDVNKDGVVDAGDAVIISRYDAGLIDRIY